MHENDLRDLLECAAKSRDMIRKIQVFMADPDCKDAKKLLGSATDNLSDTETNLKEAYKLIKK